MKPLSSLFLLLFFTVGCLSPTTAQPEAPVVLPTTSVPTPKETERQILPSTQTPTDSLPEKDVFMPPTEPSTSYPAGIAGLIERAQSDLSTRLSIQADQITVIEAVAVVWANASLGCPQPGMMYAEVLTSGYRIILQANGQNYEYHTSTGTEVVYCTNPQPPVSGTPSDQ